MSGELREWLIYSSLALLVIHCCVTNYSNIQQLKTTNIYFFLMQLPRDRNLEVALLGSSGSGSPMRETVKLLDGALVD